MIERFRAVLAEAGLDPTPRELLDALWLAEHIIVPAPPLAGLDPQAPDLHFSPPRDLPPAPELPTGQELEGEENEASAPTATAFHAAGSSDEAGSYQPGLPAQAPAVPALRNQLGMARALRPLKRRALSSTSFTLDEEATAARSAEGGGWLPVLRPAPTRWLDLTMVVDESPSMAVWRRNVTEFTALLQRLGAFRSIRVVTLDARADPAVPILVRTGSRAYAPAQEPSVITDPSGRQLILVLTDGIGPAWRDGRMLPVLEDWGSAAPTAVVAVLPERMWTGTALRLTGDQLLATLPGQPNRAWTARSTTQARHVPVPVLELTPRWLAPFAQLVGTAAVWHNTATLRGAASVGDLGPSVRARDTGPQEIVRAFGTAVSPLAFRLACYLSVTGLNLPVMRLVQQLMLPESDTSHLAEVFLGGLLYPVAAPGEATDPEKARYEFLPGVRDELSNHLLKDDALKVLHEASAFVSSRFGDPLDFDALIADPEGAPLPALSQEGEQALAYIPIGILDRLGGPYRTLAQRLRARAAQESVAPGGAQADELAPSRDIGTDEARADEAPIPDPPVYESLPVRPAGGRDDGPQDSSLHAETIKIALWGAPGSGKTTFLAALRHAIGTHDESVGRWSIVALSQESSYLLVELSRSLNESRFPAATPPGVAIQAQWLLYGDIARSKYDRRIFRLGRRSREARFILDIMDQGGEVFGHYPENFNLRGAADSALRHLSEADGIIYLYDPVTDRETGTAIRYFNRTITELKMLSYRRRGHVGHLPQQVAVCVTKFDDPEVFLEARRNGFVQTRADGMPHVPDTMAKEFFDTICAGTFWSRRSELGYDRSAAFIRNELASTFSPAKVSYYVTSSIGFYRPPSRSPSSRFDPDDFANSRYLGDGQMGIRGPIHPINVLEPVVDLWDRVSRSRKNG